MHLNTRLVSLQNRNKQKLKHFHLIFFFFIIFVSCIWGFWFAFSKYQKQTYTNEIQEIQNKVLSKKHFSAKKLKLNKINADKSKKEKQAESGLSRKDLKEAALKIQMLENDIVGSIFIPSVQIKEPILKNDTKTSLAIGVGEMKPEQFFGEYGNYALAGHNEGNKYPHLLFSNLHNIKKGDSIFLTDLTNIYTYTVSYTKYIKETDTQVIKDSNVKPTQKAITLITCDNMGIGTTGRFLVRGFLTKIKLYQQKTDKNNFSFNSKKQISN